MGAMEAVGAMGAVLDKGVMGVEEVGGGEGETA